MRFKRFQGYKSSQEQIVIEGIAVQFIPVYNDLVKDGVLDAAEKKYGNTPTRVLKPKYLIALMLQIYRSKDKERLSRFLQETTINYPLLDSILLKYNLKSVFETSKSGRQTTHHSRVQGGLKAIRKLRAV